MNAEVDTLKGRDRVADVATLSLHRDILELRGAISAYEVEAEFLRFLIERF
jgi:hypothetical protein